MRFDANKRRYVDAHGHVISPSQVKKEITNYIEQERGITQRKAEQMLSGKLSVNSFFYFMDQRLEAWHTVAGSIAYGGKAQLDKRRETRINNKIESERKYLSEFKAQTKKSFAAARAIASRVADDVSVLPIKALSRKLAGSLKHKVEKRVFEALVTTAPSEAEEVARKAAVEELGSESGILASVIHIAADLAENLIGGTVVNRAGMYPDAAYATFQNNVVERESDSGVTLGRRICAEDEASCDECVSAAQDSADFVPLDELDEIGSLTCMNNCRCEFEFSISGTEFAASDVFQGVVEGQDAYGGSVTLQ
jgi:hypothetical protein